MPDLNSGCTINIFLIDPRDNIPRYAGKGKGNRCHYNHCHNRQLTGWKRNLKDKGLEPIVELIYTIDEESALWLERVAIAAFGRLDEETGTLF